MARYRSRDLRQRGSGYMSLLLRGLSQRHVVPRRAITCRPGAAWYRPLSGRTATSGQTGGPVVQILTGQQRLPRLDGEAGVQGRQVRSLIATPGVEASWLASSTGIATAARGEIPGAWTRTTAWEAIGNGLEARCCTQGI